MAAHSFFKAGVKDINTGRPLTEARPTKDEYTGKDFDDEPFIVLRTPKMCAELFQLLGENGGPEQKAIAESVTWQSLAALRENSRLLDAKDSAGLARLRASQRNKVARRGIDWTSLTQL